MSSGETEPSGAASFSVPGVVELYDRYIGRYGPQLAQRLIAAADVRPGMTVVDVGCGPGALTSALVDVVGAGRVLAVEPSEPFAAACRARHPGVDVQQARAESMPIPDAAADRVLSQLVVNFLEDPRQGLAEMRRVAVPGGIVAAVVWDYADRMTLLRAFWDAAVETDASGRAERLDEGVTMRVCNPRGLQELWEGEGLEDVAVEPVEAAGRWSSFDELWGPIEGGVGPSGAWAAALDPRGREALRDALHRRLGRPAADFEVIAGAWCVSGRVPGS